MPRVTSAILFLSMAGILAISQEFSAAQNSLSEKQKIEALIRHVEGLQGAVFIRNGAEYSAGNAAKFLRGKWERQQAEVKSAREFIAKIATASSTSGQPYRIRLKNGTEKNSGEYLNEQLKKLE